MVLCELQGNTPRCHLHPLLAAAAAAAAAEPQLP